MRPSGERACPSLCVSGGDATSRPWAVLRPACAGVLCTLSVSVSLCIVLPDEGNSTTLVAKGNIFPPPFLSPLRTSRDLGINAAQRPQRQQSPAFIPMMIRNATTDQRFLDPIGRVPKIRACVLGVPDLDQCRCVHRGLGQRGIPQQHCLFSEQLRLPLIEHSAAEPT